VWISTSTVLGVQSISLVRGGVESNHHQEAAMEDRKLTREEIALRILSGLIAGYAGGGGQSTKFSSAVDKFVDEDGHGNPVNKDEPGKAIRTAFMMADLFIQESDKQV
jgi:hypothetical protein